LQFQYDVKVRHLLYPTLALGVISAIPVDAALAKPAPPRNPVPRRDGQQTRAPAPPRTRSRAAGADLRRCAALYRDERYRRARDCFRALAGRPGQPPSPVLLYALGYCHYQLGEYEAALRRFRQSRARQPRDGDTLFMMGMTQVRLRRHRRALASFRRALELGLQSESPAEARRYVRLLERLMRQAPAVGWLYHAQTGAGFDSHPRLEGRAALSGTSDGSSDEGSGFATLGAGVGYRWRLGRAGRAGRASVHYALHQRLLFHDLSDSVTRQAGRYSVEPPELSLQHHRLGGAGRLRWRLLEAALAVTGELELTGLESFTASLAGLTVAAELTARWHRITWSTLDLSVAPQWALNDAVDYLSGVGLWLEVTQRLRWKRLRAGLSYRFARWWLGALRQDVADCPPGLSCILELPFSHQAHRAQLTLGVRVSSWLRIEGWASVTHRAYAPEATFRDRDRGGDALTIQRVDVLQRYGLRLRFPLGDHLSLHAQYRYALNHSTLTEEETGIDEEYQRHVILAGVRYAR